MFAFYTLQIDNFIDAFACDTLKCLCYDIQ